MGWPAQQGRQAGVQKDGEGRRTRRQAAVDAQMARTGSDVPMAGLKPEDMAAIRALGGSLRDIGSQLKDLSTTVSNVSANDKIMPSPNEQSAAQRILDDQPKPTNNRGNSGPGV